MLHPVNIMPYMGVENERTIELDGRHFHVWTYQAYNAHGLIGPESNGIAIADMDTKQILCDEIAQESSGYFGVSEAQRAEFDRICGMHTLEFQEFINSHPRSRFKLDLQLKAV